MGSGVNRLRFGTDGIRGLANVELGPERVLELGRAAACVLGGDRVLIGRDTRLSGAMLEAALAAGITSAGVDVDLLGVLPTPAIAHHAARNGVAAAVISASHNPYADNGVKLFAPGGTKLTDEQQQAVEDALDTASGQPVHPRAEVGTITAVNDPLASYADAVVASIDGRSLTGVQLVLDCANGAASVVAPSTIRSLGAEVEVINASPDGRNINDGCGSTHPDQLALHVRSSSADLGLAFDGDADRVLAVDATGRLIDGDVMLALFARDRLERGLLTGRGVVVTVMSNLGLRRAMDVAGIEVVETPVGDRHVLSALERTGWSLGGEQSGHIVFRELATTGDGLLTAVQLVDLVARSARPLEEMADEALVPFPQVLVNVRVDHAAAAAVMEAITDDVQLAEHRLGDRGRVLVRPSGTEPLVRVMVEAETDDLARTVTASLVERAEKAAAALS